MGFSIIRNDITRVSADAIVNSANPRPIIGDGTDRAIHTAAGPELLRARQAIGNIPCGASAITPAFGLSARYVIHTVSPCWNGGGHGEEEVLRRAYDSALQLAHTHHCRSIAFPLMAAGSYGFPRDLALSVAVRACYDFLLHHRMKIDLVVFNSNAYVLSQRLVDEVKTYIDEYEVQRRALAEYVSGNRSRRSCDLCSMQEASFADPVQQLQKHLEERLREQHETFTEALLRIMREKDLIDPEVYCRISMDRKTFNKIKNDPKHHPRKKTAVQLAIALRLNKDQTRDFLGRAGYAFSASEESDLIVSYCIENCLYTPEEIDALLVHFGQEALFSTK